MEKEHDKPPPYQETPPAHAGGSGPLGKAVFRLRVWHYCITRWSVTLNHEFANRFRDLNLEHWIVNDAAYIYPGEASERDDFVPVEASHTLSLQSLRSDVEFQYRELSLDDTTGVLGSHVRDLFAGHACVPTYDFFLDIRSTPHSMNIFPLYNLRGTERRYTYAKVLCSLNTRTREFVVPDVGADANQFRAALQTSQDGLNTLSSLVQAFAAYLYGLYRRSQAGQQAGQAAMSRDGIEDMLNQSPLNHLEDFARLANAIRGLYAGTQPPQLHGENAHLEEWNRAQRPRQELRRLFIRVQSACRRTQNGEKLGHEDVYDLVQDVRKMKIDSSRYELDTRKIEDRLKEDTEKEKREAATTRNVGAGAIVTSGAGAVVLLTCWNPVGWVGFCAWFSVGAVAEAGGTAAVEGQKRVNRANDKMNNIKEVDVTRTTFVHSLDFLLAALAGVHCFQTLGLALDIMGEHEKENFLRQMGVDAKAMRHAVFRQELMAERLVKFTEDGLAYEAAWNTVQADTNLRTIIAVEEG